MIEYTDEQHDSLIRGHRKQLADAQATVEALQRERDAAKASRDMWKREAYLIGDALRPLCGLSEYEFGWKPAVKIIADKLAALDAEREKAKNDATAYRKLSEQWNATDLELSQLKALVRAFFTSEDKWVVAYRELERLGYTWTPRRLKMASILRAEVQEKMKIGMPFGAKSKNEAETEAKNRKRIK